MTEARHSSLCSECRCTIHIGDPIKPHPDLYEDGWVHDNCATATIDYEDLGEPCGRCWLHHAGECA